MRITSSPGVIVIVGIVGIIVSAMRAMPSRRLDAERTGSRRRKLRTRHHIETVRILKWSWLRRRMDLHETIILIWRDPSNGGLGPVGDAIYGGRGFGGHQDLGSACLVSHLSGVLHAVPGWCLRA